MATPHDFYADYAQTSLVQEALVWFLGALRRKATPDKVLEGLKRFKGKVLKTSLIKNEKEKLGEVQEQIKNSLIESGCLHSGQLNVINLRKQKEINVFGS
jgi:uncharacterized membrane protein